MTSGRHVCLDKTKPDMTNIDKTSKYYCTIPQMTMDPENFRSPSWHETQRNHHLIHCETTSIWRFPKMGLPHFFCCICNGKSYKPMDDLVIPIFFRKPPKTRVFTSNWHSPSSVISCMQCHLSTFIYMVFKSARFSVCSDMTFSQIVDLYPSHSHWSVAPASTIQTNTKINCFQWLIYMWLGL